MQNLPLTESRSVRRALLYLVVAGLALIAYSGTKGHEGFITSLGGWSTGDWPPIQARLASVGTVSRADTLWLPPQEQTWKAYFYEVSGNTYRGARYDVHGNAFVGTLDAVRAYKSPLEFTVYYNPENPAEAVVKKGISIDHATTLCLMGTVLGLLMTLAGLFGYISRRHQNPPSIVSERGAPIGQDELHIEN